MSAADAVLVTHVAFVAFVVLGFLVFLAGAATGREWARSPWLRGLHLAAIVVVCLEAWFGIACPLTVWESALRAGSGGGYTRGFVADWLGRLLYWEAPEWVFTVVYTAFGAAVAWLWWWAPPRRLPSRRLKSHPLKQPGADR
jgi:hypothetical protein